MGDRKENATMISRIKVARILVEFLEVAITSIVFLKGVYPSGAFERRRYKNLVVHRARHPQLSHYIHSAVSGLLPYIEKVDDADLEFALRSFLIKLPASGSLTEVVSRDCRWEITAYFRGLPETGSSKDVASLWIPTDTKQWQQPPLITPIKSMSSEPLSLQLYLEHPSLSEPTNP
ncbi:hypothetical protein CRG98_004254 [Punica granatum]|uniref:HORMA domain-containing protein n=1 Tax=Punica granatum TaxID=22663 RepID=A0A2I0L410_PUNGR|nr:hypothetical protein CRG98_004254 [Punica granatum]